jgi:hypothetical protein
MKVVDEHKSVRAIEDKLAAGMIEEVIYQAHNEIKLVKIMKNWKPWDHIYSEVEDKDSLLNMISFSPTNPFASHFEHYNNVRSDRPPRPETAGMHPEDKISDK